MERLIRGALPGWVEERAPRDLAFGLHGCDGYGYGDGDGSGSGYGDGYGYGSGYGSGSGYGDGSGSGDGSGYWMTVYRAALRAWPTEQRDRLKAVEETAAAIAFWKSDRSGMPSNGGQSIEAARPGVVHSSTGRFELCHAGALHATMDPGKWKGERLWVVALFGELKLADDKLAAQTREIIGEIALT